MRDQVPGWQNPRAQPDPRGTGHLRRQEVPVLQMVNHPADCRAASGVVREVEWNQ